MYPIPPPAKPNWTYLLVMFVTLLLLTGGMVQEISMHREAIRKIDELAGPSGFPAQNKLILDDIYTWQSQWGSPQGGQALIIIENQRHMQETLSRIKDCACGGGDADRTR